MAQTIRSRIEAATKKLKQRGQEHLMRFVEQLNRQQRLQLLQDVESIDLNLIDRLTEQFIRQEPHIELPQEIKPAPYYPAVPPPAQEQEYQLARERGERLIAEHKVAAFTVAGGQGTRLNYDGPKGEVPVTPVRNKTLFHVFAESIRAIERRYNCIVPWYIMTSAANHEQTVAGFASNDYFGLDSDNVMHFRQGMIPSLDTDGKILLAAQDRIAMNPDGHGGSLRALHTSGALDDMARRGIKFISYFQVDNPLVMPIDPLFIGLHAAAGAEMSSKAVIKCDPLEKVGNFALVDNNITVIEYSDLPDELALKRNPDDRLLFELGNCAIHVITCSFVERLNQRGFSLPWHRAIKKVACINDTGRLVEPTEPNAIKFEAFVFDAIPLAEKSIILEIDRADQFAPVKNATGPDTLYTSQGLQMERAARWMQEVGIEVPRKPDGSLDVMIEISPLFALDAHELGHKRSQLRPLKPGDIVYLG